MTGVEFVVGGTVLVATVGVWWRGRANQTRAEQAGWVAYAAAHRRSDPTPAEIVTAIKKGTPITPPTAKGTRHVDR